MAMLGEKLGGGPTDRPADVLRTVLGVLFLRSSRVRPTLLGQHKRLPCTGTVRKKPTSDVRGLARKAYMSRVSSFPLQVVY
jgi:hypothetical protein